MLHEHTNIVIEQTMTYVPSSFAYTSLKHQHLCVIHTSLLLTLTCPAQEWEPQSDLSTLVLVEIVNQLFGALQDCQLNLFHFE